MKATESAAGNPLTNANPRIQDAENLDAAWRTGIENLIQDAENLDAAWRTGIENWVDDCSCGLRSVLESGARDR